MRTLTYSLLLLIFSFTLTFAYADGKGDGFTKVISKEFKVNADNKVEIENMYGDVVIRTWTKNVVSIEVTITVDAKDQSEADERFTHFEIEFDQGEDYVAAETNIKSWNKKRSYWPWKWNRESGSEYSIDYIINMPATNKLDLELKYGTAIIPDLNSDVTIEISYGELKSESIGGKFDLELSHSEGEIKQVKDGSIEASYSSVRLQEGQKLSLDSRYSNIFIGAAKEIVSESRYDIYDIGDLDVFDSEGRYDAIKIADVNKVKLEGNFSDYSIGNLHSDGFIDLSYGKAEIKNVSNQFEHIYFNGQHADLQLNTDPGDSYNLSIESEHTSVIYPKNIYKSDIKEEHTSLEFRGIIGKEKVPSARITVEMKYGSVKFQ